MSYKQGTIDLLQKRLVELNREAELIRQEIQRLQYSAFEEDIREPEVTKRIIVFLTGLTYYMVLISCSYGKYSDN